MYVKSPQPRDSQMPRPPTLQLRPSTLAGADGKWLLCTGWMQQFQCVMDVLRAQVPEQASLKYRQTDFASFYF